MRCWIRFGGHWQASNSLLLNITHTTVFPLVVKFKNVIITCPFFNLPGTLLQFTKLFPENTEIHLSVFCVSQGPDLAWAGSDYWAASRSSVPKGASGRGADAFVRRPDGIWKCPAGSRLRNSRHQSHLLTKKPTGRQIGTPRRAEHSSFQLHFFKLKVPWAQRPTIVTSDIYIKRMNNVSCPHLFHILDKQKKFVYVLREFKVRRVGPQRAPGSWLGPGSGSPAWSFIPV